MKKLFVQVITIIFFIFIIFTPGCKTAEEVIQYTLTVDIGTGATGTPASGSHKHEQNAVVSYNYTLESGYQNLAVTLDGNSVSESGTFTITGNHTLAVTAEEIFDIRGNWRLTLDWETGPSDTWDITFSGGLNSGTYMDEFAHTGTWTVNGSNVEIDYPVYPMELVGAFTSQTEMSGDITGCCSGTWSATKL